MAKDETEGCWAALGKLTFGFLLMPTAAVAHTLVVAAYWRWFITPQFSLTVPPLWLLYGLCVMAELFRRPEMHDAPPELKKSFIKLLLESLFVSGWAYCIGWLIKTYGPMVS